MTLLIPTMSRYLNLFPRDWPRPKHVVTDVHFPHCVLTGLSYTQPGRVAQSVGHLTRVSQGSWVRYPVWQHTFVSPSAFSQEGQLSVTGESMCTKY